LSGINPLGTRGKHAPRRRWTTPLGVVALTLLVLMGAVAVAGYAYARTSSDRLLSGLEVAGVDVSGMTRAEAVAAVQRIVNADLARTVTVTAATKTWTTSPAALGVRGDVARAVDEAFAASNSQAWPVSAYDRITHHSLGRSIQVPYTYPTEQAQSLVDQVASAVDRKPTKASISLDGDQLVIRHARTGRTVPAAAALSTLLGAVRAGLSSVALPDREVKPKVTARTLGKTITVNLSTNTLRLFKGFKVIRQFPVATAMQAFVTPIGTWKVVTKEFMPAWYNPAPNGWAKDMPKYIAPGPGNPLGLRALALDASGILIHGTPEDYSIGSYASHGCIRMHETDAIALFPLVPQGTTVIIYGAPPWGNRTMSAPAGF
jgi:lipoprotein-anchoring transpeptidase ErfK/SrfK